jgi:4-amino-4-deoxychorismate lyase
MGLIRCFINGRPNVGLSPYDRGFSYGHGLFETMRLWKGCLPLIDLHLRRLAKGSKVLSLSYDAGELVSQIDDALAIFPQNGIVKLILSAGDAERGFRYPRESKATSVLQYFESSASQNIETLQLCHYRLPHNPRLAGIKHLNRLDQVIAASELASHHDGLLLDQSGFVIEALSRNIFLMVENRWLTPSLLKSGVSGVMRTLLTEKILPSMGIPVDIKDIDIDLLSSASEVFVCNAVTGITPVTELAGVARWANVQQTTVVRDSLIEQYQCFGE